MKPQLSNSTTPPDLPLTSGWLVVGGLLALAHLTVGEAAARPPTANALQSHVKRETPRSGQVVYRGARGRVSVDGGPFRPLPAEFAPDNQLHTLVVVLEDCSGVAKVAFTVQEREWYCASPHGPQVEVISQVPSLIEILVDGDTFKTFSELPPHEKQARHPVALPPSARDLEVRCEAPGHAPWRAHYDVENAGHLRVECAPVPERRLLVLSVNAPDAIFSTLQRQVPGLHELSGSLTFGGPRPSIGRYARAGVRYVTHALRAGPHLICAAAPGHVRRCETVGIGARPGVARLHFELSRIPPLIPPPPPPPTSVVSVPSAGGPPAAMSGWQSSLVWGGAALGAAGVGLWIDGQRDAWLAREHLRAGAITEAREARLQREADPHRLTGQALASVGFSAALGGLIWWLTADNTQEPVRRAGSSTRGGHL